MREREMRGLGFCSVVTVVLLVTGRMYFRVHRGTNRRTKRKEEKEGKREEGGSRFLLVLPEEATYRQRERGRVREEGQRANRLLLVCSAASSGATGRRREGERISGRMKGEEEEEEEESSLREERGSGRMGEEWEEGAVAWTERMGERERSRPDALGIGFFL